MYQQTETLNKNIMEIALQTPNTLTSLQDVSILLNSKYSKITGFETKVIDNVVKGGFYKMNYNHTTNGYYYFHETFIRLTETRNTYEKLFMYANDVIQNQLKFQKQCDESYAKEFNKQINYKYDYSLIEA